ncbi:ATP-binding cassette subfamily F protein 3 [Dysgonomonas sp. PH5-45]|uniref:ABC-F family ATP-binding cassette domain-containing protein n=1 Tax=unclassified Dysgonomonas TaxID=2630389 RepID=UPI002474E041|nr:MULTISPECIES: ABC-F family ATP-binding cassette domain-containing protein [unclassified Dysgonomonas]MDH6355426.1 ATP-binding cassette subfamily F protein 3 [Dysgonomonas sp. PH5-45]MDH6388323.1 ATP-binding cassette subfamily F protein 3 [Dysgonomonas sp. PH5-37]
MLIVESLKVELSGRILFDNINFIINDKDRIALVGKNGAGKSTMLKILAGVNKNYKGTISMPDGTTVGYLPQVMMVSDERTVREEASLAFSHIFELQDQIEEMNKQLETRTDYESDSYARLIDDFTHAHERLARIEDTNFEGEVEKTLLGLGFKRSDLDRPTSEFSGGWRMRIELAKLLLSSPDIMLLDEPTNHLDIESIGWLEEFIQTKANAVVLISHDRAFIDAVTNRTIELTLGKIYDYKVNYTKYLELRQERRQQQIHAWEAQQKQIQEIEEFIERFRAQAAKAVLVQSRVRQLEKMERVEIDEEDKSSVRIRFQPAVRSGNYPLTVEMVTKLYDDYLVFENANFMISRGEKIALAGKNGEGKSTFVKCVMGETPYTGNIMLGHNVKVGYFAQNQADLLDEDLTVFETIDRVAEGDIRTHIRNILGAFMFNRDDSDKKVRVLSGGERTRLAMIKLLLEPVNLLILDEPTNHLDLKTKEVLKNALLDYDGTVILVSHDRDFLDGLVTKVYEFSNKKVREHIGGIKEFLAKKKTLSS